MALLLVLFTTVLISRTNTYTQGALCFIFNLRIKIGLIICTTNYICYILGLSFLISRRKTYAYLSNLASSALQKMGPSLPLSQSILIHI
jgi:hypothetical protein